MRAMRHSLLWLLVSMRTVALAQAWPAIVLPPDTDTFVVSNQLTTNGVPMQIQGFIAKNMKIAQAAEWFKRSLGEPLVENRLGKKIILGRAQGGYYLTVQLESMRDDGVASIKGFAAVSDIAAFNAAQSQQINDVSRWLDRWPAGTQEMNRVLSQDHRKTSRYVVLRNGHSVELNRFALIEALKPDGLSVEREATNPSGAGVSLYFKGAQKEAMATIAKNEAGKTDIVINTITHSIGNKKQ